MAGKLTKKSLANSY